MKSKKKAKAKTNEVKIKYIVDLTDFIKKVREIKRIIRGLKKELRTISVK
jgi:hypothetical protein